MSSATVRSGTARRVTLLTDFGTADGYVAAMKGVIASIAPSTVIDDASHDIPPGDVPAASWALGAYWNLYPPGTIHVVVVDPGVGSSRRPLAINIDQRFIIAPDNGVLTAVLREITPTECVEIRNPDVLSSTGSATFHGRDVFAPAAGRLATGMPLPQLGPPLLDPVLLPATAAVRDGAAIIGSVVHVDRFGNLITDIPGRYIRGGSVRVDGSRSIPVLTTYADVASGQQVSLVGSRGFVEVSVRDGSAAEELRARRGTAVVWVPE